MLRPDRNRIPAKIIRSLAQLPGPSDAAAGDVTGIPTVTPPFPDISA